MARSRLVLMSALVLVSVVFLTGCDRLFVEPQTKLSPSTYCGVAEQVTLIAGQNTDAGNVMVWNDQTNIYVQFNATGNWVINETHVAVATSLAGIPQKNGNPIPGQFPYKMKHDPAVMTYTYTIPLGNWPVGQQLYIAAHASMSLLDGNGNVIRKETGWGFGPGFPGKNWATYFNYTVKPCDPPTNLIGRFRTQTQGGWGSAPNGNNPGMYLHQNFDNAFPNGLIVGGIFTLALNSAQSVTDYLPDGGPPAAYTQNWVDPGNQMISVLSGQVVALSLSVGFDLYDPNFSPDPVNLKDLKVADISSPYYGWTVWQVLDAANTILGGDQTPGTPADINQAVSAINENFVDGTIDQGFLMLP